MHLPAVWVRRYTADPSRDQDSLADAGGLLQIRSGRQHIQDRGGRHRHTEVAKTRLRAAANTKPEGRHELAEPENSQAAANTNRIGANGHPTRVSLKRQKNSQAAASTNRIAEDVCTRHELEEAENSQVAAPNRIGADARTRHELEAAATATSTRIVRRRRRRLKKQKNTRHNLVGACVYAYMYLVRQKLHQQKSEHLSARS